jgi:hypothetical protein
MLKVTARDHREKKFLPVKRKFVEGSEKESHFNGITVKMAWE